MLSLTCLCLWLLAAPMQCVKIGVAHSYNTSTTTTTTTAAATTTLAMTTSTELPMTTTILDINSTDSPQLENASSTPSQSFPPRKPQKPRTTVAPTKRATTPATTVAPVATSTTALARQDSRFYYCACDLLSGRCELNCCCDRDCPQQTLQVFSCSRSAAPPQLQTRLEDFQYTHGLPTCQLSDGWLCVFRSNTKPATMQSLSSNFDASQFNKWPELLDAYETQLPPAQFTSHYKFGQALQLWQPEFKQVSSLELPMAYESSSCQVKQTLLHLQPVQSSCLLSDAAQLQTSLWELLNVTSSHQLLSRPLDPDEPELLQGIPIQICQQLLLQPQLVCLDGNDTQVDMLVDSVELQLMHNYTHILEAKLLLKEAAVREENEPIWLNYALIYKPLNDIQTKPSSGPLGYVLGSPVLLATLVAQNNSETGQAQPQRLLNYFQSNTSGAHHQHWLTPCQSSQAVGFGVDLAKQCELRQLAPLLAEHDNRTDYCQQLQADIWRQLLPANCTRLEDLGQVFVSQLGRPQPDKWLPLRLSQADGQQMAPVQGVYNEQQQTLSCRNIWLSVRYEFHVAELTLLEGRVPHQSVLRHASLVLGQRHDLEFDAAEQQVELPLSVSVMFFKAQDKLINGSNIRHVANSGLISITTFLILMLADKSQ